MAEIEISQKLKFSDFCIMCEKVKISKDILRKEKILKEYLKRFNELKLSVKDSFTDDNFYCVLRLLLPKTDTNRDSYGLQITSLGRIYVKILGINSTSDTAKKLQYKGDANVEKGDYAETVYSIMKSRSNDVPSAYTIFEINLLLDLLASGTRQNQEIELTKFIEQSSAMEQKWLIRILLKKMYLQIGEQKIFGIYHEKSCELYRKITDLKKVCKIIESSKDDNITLDLLLTRIQPFQYVKPMLCEKLFITKLSNIFENQKYFLETKMDGERFQVHVENGIFRYMSRNGFDYTKHFGHNNSSGNLSPILSKLINDSVKSIILDGEMMVWDKSNQKFRIKGEHYDVKHLQIGGNLSPCFVVYDMLFLNGDEYIGRPYIERINKLKTILKEQTGILNLCKRIELNGVESFMTQFNLALEQNEEGVVIKQHMSSYKPGRRFNSGWYKLKPDYVNGLTSDFDMIVLGVFKDAAKGYIKSYLIGVIEKDEEAIVCHSVAKVAAGLSRVECEKINNNLEKYLKTTECPYILGNLRPDSWIEPQNSIVFQIRASELFLTQDFATKYSLRFPRVEAIRNDKSWNECMYLQEYLQFAEENSSRVHKISKRHLVADDLTNKKIKSMHSNPYLSDFRINDIDRVTNIFDGISFCILSGSSDFSIDELKKIVIKHGGTIVDNPLLDSSKCIVIAGSKTLKVKQIISTKRYNVVSLDWLVRCFSPDVSKTENFEPRYREIICSTPEMEEKIKLKFDQYGDSYTIHVDVPELIQLLSEINESQIPNLSKSELDALSEEINQM